MPAPCRRYNVWNAFTSDPLSHCCCSAPSLTDLPCAACGLWLLPHAGLDAPWAQLSYWPACSEAPRPESLQRHHRVWPGVPAAQQWQHEAARPVVLCWGQTLRGTSCAGCCLGSFKEACGSDMEVPRLQAVMRRRLVCVHSNSGEVVQGHGD